MRPDSQAAVAGAAACPRYMKDCAPPALKWLLGQLCHIHGSEIVISKPNLETLATMVLSNDAPAKSSKIVRDISDFFASDHGQMFSCGVHYSVDAVPVLLGDCGLELSVHAWEDATWSLSFRLETCSCASSSSHAGSGVDSPAEESMSLADTGSLAQSQDVSSDGVSDMSDGSAWFEELSRQELLQKLHARDKEVLHLRRSLDKSEQTRMTEKQGVGALRMQLKQSKRFCRSLMLKVSKAEDRQKKMQCEIDQMKAMIVERRGKYLKDAGMDDHSDRGWLTPAGVVQLALKRNLAHCASEHLQLVIQQDVSRWTVSRYLACIVFASGDGIMDFSQLGG